MNGGVRIPITLIFRDELIVADVAFDHEPTPAEVRDSGEHEATVLAVKIR